MKTINCVFAALAILLSSGIATAKSPVGRSNHGMVARPAVMKWLAKRGLSQNVSVRALGRSASGKSLIVAVQNKAGRKDVRILKYSFKSNSAALQAGARTVKGSKWITQGEASRKAQTALRKERGANKGQFAKIRFQGLKTYKNKAGNTTLGYMFADAAEARGSKREIAYVDARTGALTKVDNLQKTRGAAARKTSK